MPLIVNFKSEIQGKDAESLAKTMEKVNYEKLIAVVSPFDIEAVKKVAPKLQVWSQTIDPNPYRPLTGNLNLDTAIERGADGALINHVECPVGLLHVKKLVNQAPVNFKVCVCVTSLYYAQQVLAECDPDYIAIEPSELIGTSACMKMDIVKKMVKKLKNKTKIIIGAGINTPLDVARITSEGADGVLVSSCITNSTNKEIKLYDLSCGLINKLKPFLL